MAQRRVQWGAALLALGFVVASGSRTPADNVTIEAPTIHAADGGMSHGLLYWDPTKRPKTVVVSMHPSSDTQRHFVLRPAAERGYAGFGLAGRYTGQDAAVHEPVLLDLAAAIKWLKEERGFTHVLLVGHSGGGSLMAYYDNIKKVTVPTLVLGGTADRGIFPSEQKATFQMSGAKDKTIVWIEGGDHGFNPSGPKAGDGKQQERAAVAVLAWMDTRFPK